MRVAIVHELLTRKGGAERIAKIFSEMFPDAPIFTLLYDEKKMGDWFSKERVISSGIEKQFPYALLPTSHKYNHHIYLKQFPKVVEQWNFSEYDLVLSSSSAFAHGIITNGSPRHLSYVHSPARYLWDSTHQVQQTASQGLLGPLKKHHLSKTFHKLREWDAYAAARADVLIANSNTVQRRIKLYWERAAEVINPPIEDFWFKPLTVRPNSTPYFLIVSTLARYKQIDVAIAACNQLGVTLNIIGEGPDKNRLQTLAGPTVHFLGYQPDEVVQQHYQSAAALIFAGEDDFGLVPIEAMACGCPVIAYRKGGATETIIENQTGVFFDTAESSALIEAMQKNEGIDWDSGKISAHAQKWRRSAFEEQIKALI